MDPGLNELLKWGIENSAKDPNSNSNGTSTTQPPSDPSRGLNPDILAQLLGGPSDADRMKDMMAAIQNPEVNLENKLIAFDNLEQLVEGIDNANNLEPLKLWVPLVKELENEEAELRSMAAWCIGTAVQNNEKAQERLLVLGAIPTLVKIATEDSSQAARKKAILALSSGIRNYQPSLDAAIKALPASHKVEGPIDATDMEPIDAIIQNLRDESAKMG